MPFNIQGPELILILVIALVVLGPGKLPEVGSALGRSIREFRKAATDVKEATSIEPLKTPDAPAEATRTSLQNDAPVSPPPEPNVLAAAAAPNVPAAPAAPVSGSFEDRPPVAAAARPSDSDAPAS